LVLPSARMPWEMVVMRGSFQITGENTPDITPKTPKNPAGETSAGRPDENLQF
jgi:hypothetical protein